MTSGFLGANTEKQRKVIWIIKLTFEENEPFTTLSFIFNSKSKIKYYRPIYYISIEEKKNWIDLWPLISPKYHQFYYDLKTLNEAEDEE